MSNSYQLLPGLTLEEQSLKLQFMMEGPSYVLSDLAFTRDFTPEQLRTAIIKQIEVLSYFSDDPEEVLRRFNVNYGQTE